jgi:hypothetical protein
MKNFAGPFLAIVAAGALGLYLLRGYVQNYQDEAANEDWAATVATYGEGYQVSSGVHPPGTIGPFIPASGVMG